MKKIFDIIMNLVHFYFGGGKEAQAQARQAAAKDKRQAAETKRTIGLRNQAKKSKDETKTISELQSKKKFVFAIGVLLVASAACIPEIPAPITQVVNECTLVEPFEKPELPTVKYTKDNGNRCFANSEQENNAVLRELLLIEYANNMTDLYKDAMLRCNEN